MVATLFTAVASKTTVTITSAQMTELNLLKTHSADLPKKDSAKTKKSNIESSTK